MSTALHSINPVQVVRGGDLEPVAITAGIGKTAAKTATSVQLRRGGSFKLHITLTRDAAQPPPGRRQLLPAWLKTKTAPAAPVNPVSYLLRVDVPGAGGLGKGDKGASFQLARTVVSPAVAANGTWTAAATKKRHAPFPPTNVTRVVAEGVTRLDWWPVAVSQYTAGSGLAYHRTLTLVMRVGKAVLLGGSLAFNVSVAQIIGPDISQLGTPQVAMPPVQASTTYGSWKLGRE